MAKPQKVRVEFRKNRSKPPRTNDFTRDHQGDAASEAASGERVRVKGDLSRARTVTLDNDVRETDSSGRVLRVFGLYSDVERDDGTIIRCTIRRILKTVQTDERSAVTTGDRVRIRLDCETEGVIVHVEPRQGVLTRESRQREHVLVANVDQLVIVMALVEPDLKVHLIDRYIASAEKGNLKPILALNKVDLTDAAVCQSLVGAYSQIGIATVLTSATTGEGIERLRGLIANRTTVFSGQSGVGKSSLLNALEPGLGRRVREVSDVTNKGMHTTTTAELIRLSFGGWVVDTPGVRQFQLYDTRPEEVEGYFREFRPFVAMCGFPDCTHTHENKCAVKRAVDLRLIAERRYQSFLGMIADRGITRTQKKQS
jgi:ribosome biogenesis GTPase / thiamine phosphate phosphatase